MLYVLHKNGQPLVTERGRGFRARKKIWVFRSETTAEAQAKKHQGSYLVRYEPVTQQTKQNQHLLNQCMALIAKAADDGAFDQCNSQEADIVRMALSWEEQ